MESFLIFVICWRFLATFTFFALPIVISGAYAQSQYTVHLLDQNSQPIADAVVVFDDQRIVNQDSSTGIMDQRDRQFVPHVLVVGKGAQVSFPNSDNIRHHVYSFSEPKRFEIKLYADQPEDPVVFDKSGIVILGCNIHDTMLGYIFVSEWEYYAKTDAQGEATVSLEQAPKRLRLWHPRLLKPSELVTVDTLKWQNNRYSMQLELSEPAPVRKESRFRR